METLSDFDDDDPQSVKRWVEGMRREFGEDFGGDINVDDVIEQAEEWERSSGTASYSEHEDSSDDLDDFDDDLA